jgi:3',5'-cyclic AMP phosphodiesterase CpdA
MNDDHATILHLSDLHFGAAGRAAQQAVIAESLCEALRQTPTSPRRLLAITGDIFDSGDLAEAAVRAFLDRFSQIESALGGHVPAVLLPGNHDRRRSGVIGPFRGQLFTRLRDALASRPHVHVAGCSTPFLAERAAAASSILGAHVVAYDSTHLTSGLFSAGGAVHAEDFLQLAARLSGDTPLILLLHHHLVPTPVTDLSRVDVSAEPSHFKLLLRQAVPWLIAQGDREELTMTAFGSGTALSMLHTLRRPVLILHGHKHYPTARVLRATAAGEGDIVVASAGSAGTTQVFEPTSPEESVHIWPSFNTIVLSAHGIEISTTFFSPKDAAARPYVRPLVSARRDGAGWAVEPVSVPQVLAPPVELNETAVQLEPNRRHPSDLWDMQCTRRVLPTEGVVLPEYQELIECLAGSSCRGADIQRVKGSAYPRLRVRPGRDSSYHVAGGLCRSFAWAARVHRGLDCTPFEWVGLMVRHPSRHARLLLRGLPDAAGLAFGSVTDLHTGRQWPVGVSAGGDEVTFTLSPCPARHLLRIHWPLGSSAHSPTTKSSP